MSCSGWSGSEGRWFSAEFAEQLSHGTLLLKVGVLF